MKKDARKKIRFCVLLVVTLVCTTGLFYTVFANAKRAGDEVTQRSFDELTSETKRLANTIHTDQVILTAMADLLANQDLSDYRNPAVLEIMRSFDLDKTFISDLELLMPNERMLRRSGIWYNVTSMLDFEKEKAKGAYISDREKNSFEAGKAVIEQSLERKNV